MSEWLHCPRKLDAWFTRLYSNGCKPRCWQSGPIHKQFCFKFTEFKIEVKITTYGFHFVSIEFSNNGWFRVAFHDMRHLVSIDSDRRLHLGSISSLFFEFFSKFELNGRCFHLQIKVESDLFLRFFKQKKLINTMEEVVIVYSSPFKVISTVGFIELPTFLCKKPTSVIAIKFFKEYF